MKRRKTLPDHPQDELEFLRARVAELERERLERSQAGGTLRPSEEQYRLLVASVPDVTWTMDCKGNTTFISPNVEHVYGYKPEEIYREGRRLWFEQIHPDDLNRVSEAYESLFSSGTTFDVEYRIRNKEGRWMWIHDRAVATYQKDGREYAVGVFSDVTKRKEAEEALRDSEERSRTLFENAPVGIYRTTPDGRIINANPALTNMLGFSSFDELAMRNLEKEGFEPGYSRSKFRERLEREGEIVGLETAWKKRDGSLVLVRENARVTRGADGEVLYYDGTIEDITERKRAEEELREQKTFLDDIFASIQDGISVLDRELHIVRVNPTMERWYAHALPLSGKKCYEAYHGRSAPCEVCPTRRTLETGRTAYEVVPKRGPAGEINGWLDLYSFPMFERATGRLKGVIEYVRDITERKRAEETLRESEERLALALEATSDGLWDWNIPTGNMYFSPRYYTMLGYEPDELPASYETWASLLHPAERAATEKKIQEHVEKKSESFEVEFRLRTKSGGWRWILSRGKMVERDATGRPIRMVGTHADITERRHLEDQLRQAQKMESIGTLTSGIAHDFNNLLTIIMGNASFLLNKMTRESDLYESLEDIVKAGERAGSLIRQLLAFSRKTVLQVRATDLQRCVDETVALVRRGIDPRVEIRLRSHPALWVIRADQDQMNQVIMNLCVNARDAMPSGGTLSIETGNTVIDEAYCRDHRQARPGRYVELVISDTGAGMDKKTVARIFEPFYTTKRAGVGTGLGLAMVYGIVTQHGGWITVESKPGRGTSFHVFLPRTETPQKEKPSETKKEIPRGSETIMLVDNEQLVLDVTHRILTECGYHTVMARDGEEAVRMFEEYHREIDLVLLDIALPKIGGYQVLSAIRRIDPQIKVILCTGNMAQEGSSEVDRMASGLPLLKKPVSAETLARTVREVLDG